MGKNERGSLFSGLRLPKKKKNNGLWEREVYSLCHISVSGT